MLSKPPTRAFHPAKTNPADLDRAALILQIVCGHFECGNADLETRGIRADQFAWPRYVAARLIKDHTAMSLSVIGALFNRTLPEAFDLTESPLPPTDPRFTDLAFVDSRVKLLLPSIQ